MLAATEIPIPGVSIPGIPDHAEENYARSLRVLKLSLEKNPPFGREEKHIKKISPFGRKTPQKNFALRAKKQYQKRSS